MNYATKLIHSCSDVVLFCAKVDSWPSTGAITEPEIITKKQNIVACLQKCLGPLMLALLVFVSNLPVQADKVPSLLLALRHVSVYAPLSACVFGLLRPVKLSKLTVALVTDCS